MMFTNPHRPRNAPSAHKNQESFVKNQYASPMKSSPTMTSEIFLTLLAFSLIPDTPLSSTSPMKPSRRRFGRQIPTLQSLGAVVRANRELATLKALFNRCRQWKKFEGENPVCEVKFLRNRRVRSDSWITMKRNGSSRFAPSR